MSAIGVEESDPANVARLERRREVADQRVAVAHLNRHAVPLFGESAQRLCASFVEVEEIMPVWTCPGFVESV